MRTIVIPDVHENITVVEKILQREQHDKAVFLGDWFDRFHTQPGDTLATVQWLWDHVGDKDKEFLYGNHDMPYAFPLVYGLSCSGHQQGNQDILRFFQSDQAFEKFRLFGEVDGWMLSHAGFHHNTWPFKRTPEEVDQMHEAALTRLSHGEMHYWAVPGRARGGISPVGGCTWLDWDEEFEPIPGVKQIVGHTRHQEPQWKGDNLCLDTRLKHYAVIENGEVTVKETGV